MFDVDSIESWKSIFKGDIITLKDEQMIEDLMEAKQKGAMEGSDLTVGTVTHIKELRGIIEYVVIELVDYVIPLYLIVTIVDDDFDLSMFFVPDDFTPGSRQDVLDAGNEWIFSPPEDENDFVPCDLDFAEDFISNIENEEEETVELIYESKGDTWNCEAFEKPAASGINYPLFTQVKEYLADKECSNLECILIEYGGLDENDNLLPEGGYVTFMQGCVIQSADLSVLAQTEA